MLVGLLAVQLAVNVLKDTPGKRIIKQIPQYILFGVGVGGVSGLLRSRVVPGLRLRFIPRVPGGAGCRLAVRLCRSPGFLARRSLAVARRRAGRLFRLFAALFRLRFAGGRRAFRLGRAAGLILVSGVLGRFEYGRKSHIGFIEQLELTAGVGIAGVQIRMELKGATAVGSFDGLQIRALVELEDFVAFLDGELAGAASHRSYLRISALASQEGSWASRPSSRK